MAGIVIKTKKYSNANHDFCKSFDEQLFKCEIQIQI